MQFAGMYPWRTVGGTWCCSRTADCNSNDNILCYLHVPQALEHRMVQHLHSQGKGHLTPLDSTVCMGVSHLRVSVACRCSTIGLISSRCSTVAIAHAVATCSPRVCSPHVFTSIARVVVTCEKRERDQHGINTTSSMRKTLLQESPIQTHL